jgi:hypothetical protein
VEPVGVSSRGPKRHLNDGPVPAVTLYVVFVVSGFSGTPNSTWVVDKDIHSKIIEKVRVALARHSPQKFNVLGIGDFERSDLEDVTAL